MQLVKGGHTAVNINGEPGPFFANARGVRQGDPLSRLLFNFVANALAEMLEGAAVAGHIHGVSPQLVAGGVTHLQYADDTLILVQNDPIDLMNLKFLLLCFESMSGLKINFAKSEAFVIGADEEEQRSAAFMLNCKLGKLPMTYLGLPIDAMKLPIAAFQPLMHRVAKKVDPWLGMNSSSGGRGILIESSLSGLPLYSMSFYLLQDGIHSSFDKARSRFFWGKRQG
jgi:hypothetical protein